MLNGRMIEAVAMALLVVIVSHVRVADASWRKKMTIFERQSPDGPRHSPLFSLPVGDDGEFPQKMVLFNNDLYGSEEDLLNEDLDARIGYNQGHCVETVATDGFVAECFFTFVFDEGGSITANGPFNFNATEGVLPTVLAATGGTGDYKKHQGEAAISAGPADDFPSLQFDITVYE